jgi:peptidoglycan/LPS O-acetylase OafA/YrhL
MCLFGPDTPFRPISRIAYAGLVGLFTLLVWLGTLERSPLARAVPLVFLGELSYSLYLVHQIIGFVILDRLTAAGLGPNLSVLLACAGVVLLAYLLRRWVERPGQKAVQRAFAWWADPRKPAPLSGPLMGKDGCDG